MSRPEPPPPEFRDFCPLPLRQPGVIVEVEQHSTRPWTPKINNRQERL